MSISIDPLREAWDYILTLDLPKTSENCRTQYVAHCGGYMSELSWYILIGLSGLAITFGVMLLSIKHCRGRKQKMTMKKKKIEVAVINA